MNETKTTKKEQSFEKKLKRLSEIVSILESGEESLEKSIKLFEEGTKLSSECEKILKNAQLKVTELTENLE